MTRRKMLRLLAIVALVLGFACLSVSTFAAQKQYRIGLIVPDMVNPFWVYMKEGAEKVALENNVILDVYAPIRAYNVEDQIRIIEDLIQKKVDAIVSVSTSLLMCWFFLSVCIFFFIRLI